MPKIASFNSQDQNLRHNRSDYKTAVHSRFTTLNLANHSRNEPCTQLRIPLNISRLVCYTFDIIVDTTLTLRTPSGDNYELGCLHNVDDA
jgi:hypothetical protein